MSTLPSPAALNLRVGVIFRQARELAGLSIRDLADATGLSYSTIAAIETSRNHTLSFPAVLTIAAYLRVPIDVLVGDGPPKTRTPEQEAVLVAARTLVDVAPPEYLSHVAVLLNALRDEWKAKAPTT